MNINRYVLRKERSLQKIIKNQPKPNITAIGVCSETRSTGSYYVLNKHYLTVNKDDMVATYPYPFSCDDGANTLLEVKDTDILTPVERLFLWTEYKNPNPIETKKK